MAGPTLTTYKWQADETGTSGNFNDPNHWDKGEVPGALSLAQISISGADNPVISFPSGDYDTRASLRFDLTSVGSLTLNGTDTVLRLPSCDDDNYHEEPFGFRYAGTHHLNFQTYGDAAAVHYKHAICVISNGVWRETVPSAGNEGFRVDFLEGDYNFYDPEGTPCETPYFMLANNYLTKDVTVAFHPGTHTRMPSWQLPKNLADGCTARLAFLGGEHDIFGSFSMPMNVHYSDERSGDTVIDVTNNASLTIHGLTTIGCTVTTTGSATYYKGGKEYDDENRYFFNVGGGGRLTFAGKLSQQTAGPLFLNAGAGGTIRFDGTAAVGQSRSTATVRVEEGGRLEGDGSLTLGREDASAAHLIVDGGTVELKQLMLGFTQNDTSTSSLVLTNGADVTTTNFFLGRGTVDLAGDNRWVNRKEMYLGYLYGEQSCLNVREGGRLHTGTINVGEQQGAGTLNVAGGTLTFASSVNIGNSATATGTVNVTAGVLAGDPLSDTRINVGTAAGRGVLNISGGAVTNTSLYVPYETVKRVCSGEVNMSGGEMKVSNSLGVGYGGDGRFTLSGGTLRVLYLFLGQANANSSDDWGVFRQTGGLCDITVTSDDLGVKMADNVTRKTRLILDGGVMSVLHIFGHVGALCRGGTGYAALSANGGTIRVPRTSNRLIYTLDEAKLGPKGLTIDARANCLIEQDFTDMDDANGEGRLILAGPGQKTICATNSACSYVVLAEGTTLFQPHANGLQAKQDSSIVVTNGATLSLVGEQTGLDVRDLTLGDAVSSGRIALDADDVIRVSGALVVNDGVIVVGEGFEVGQEYDFIELAGDRSAELAEAWANIRVVSAGAVNGRGFGVKVQYDEAAGKTRIKVLVTDASATPSAVTWQGPGTDWTTDANWQGGARPTAMGLATFGAEAAPNAVTLTGAATAAGLVFNDARGYTLAGGKIVVSTLDAAVIRAEQGTNRVASALALPGRLPVEVASGAAVDLQGDVRGIDLVKTGVGRLALSGANNELTTVGISNGTFAAATPQTLGNATILQTGGTLELAGAEEEEAVYSQRVALQAPSSKKPLLIKATGDVTLPVPALTSGLPYKHGVGRLTLTADANALLAVDEGGTGDWYFKGVTVPLDADGNLQPDAVVAGFNIAEGEVVLRGTKPNVTLTAQRFFAVGVPQPSAATPPALTLDNVELNNKLNSRHLLLGSGFTDSNMQFGDVYLTATNGSTVTCDTLYVGRGNARSNMRYHVLFDDSSISCSYMMQANAGSGKGALAEYVFRNKSTLYTSRVNAPYRAKFVFDDSVYAKNANGEPAEITYDVNFSGVGATSGSDWEFRNGSVLVCNKVDAYGWPEKPTTLTFADSEWRTGAADFAFVYKHPAQVKFYVENDGLILAPPAGGTWTMQNAVAGAGGLVKRGEGTLVFDTAKRVNPDTSAVEPWTEAPTLTTLNFSGTAKVEEGTLQIVGGASAGTASVELATGTVLDLAGGASTFAKVSGTGTIQNGTIACTLASADDVNTLPVFDGDTITFGRLVFDAGDYTEENPYMKPANPVAVARYTGATPTIVGGKSIHTGVPGSLAKFTAENGVIYAQAVYRGMTINFR